MSFNGVVTAKISRVSTLFSSDRFSLFDGQEIVHLILNLRVHYRLHKSQSLDLILNHLHPVHILFKICFIIIVYNRELVFPLGFCQA
jgi:hypothetical protein